MECRRARSRGGPTERDIVWTFMLILSLQIQEVATHCKHDSIQYEWRIGHPRTHWSREKWGSVLCRLFDEGASTRVRVNNEGFNLRAGIVCNYLKRQYRHCELNSWVSSTIEWHLLESFSTHTIHNFSTDCDPISDTNAGLDGVL